MRVLSSVAIALLSLSLASCTTAISGVNSSDPYIAEQAQKTQQLQDEVKAQKQIVNTEQQKLKSLELQLDGAKQNLKGRQLSRKSS